MFTLHAARYPEAIKSCAWLGPNLEKNTKLKSTHAAARIHAISH